MSEQSNAPPPYGEIAQETGATLRHGSSQIASMPGGMVLALVVIAGLNVVVLAFNTYSLTNFLSAQEISDSQSGARAGEFLNAAIREMHGTMQRQAEMFERMLAEQSRYNQVQVERALLMAEQALVALVEDSMRAGEAAVEAIGQAGDIATDLAGEK